jgi:outer membrane protein
MKRVRSCIAILFSMLLMLPPAGAQQTAQPAAPATAPARTDRGNFILAPYRVQQVAPINLGNSNRLESLLRAGQLYLSMQDAIALALENNLDIELQRYGPRIAKADLLRANAGGAISGVSTSVSSGASSAASTTGVLAGSSATSSSGTSTSSGVSAVTSGGGPATPSLDPLLTSSYNWNHATRPLTSSFTTGTNSLISTTSATGFTLQKGFLTGTNVSLGWDTSRISQNSYRNDFNPSLSGDFNLSISQRLLQGWGLALNSRNIKIARNNLRVSDLTFQQQVITTVASVMNLYWDLVSFNEDRKVRQQAVALAEKLYNDNKKQVEIGTMAPIEIVKAEAEVAQRQQELIVSETQLLQQETILKNALSRTGVASPSLAEARIVPTDRIRLPEREILPPASELVVKAMESRPDIAQTDLQIENAKITLSGVKNSLRPSLDVVGSFKNNGLVGEVNQLPQPAIPGVSAGVTPEQRALAANQFFLGGLGGLMNQLMSRNFPDYGVAFQLNIPLRNRSAQADVTRSQLTLRQSEIRQQQQVNQLRVEVQNALITVQQARARYNSSVKARVLQEQTLDAEQKKYALGASTIYFVIQAQRDLALARSTEVAALASYGKSKVEMDRATGQTLTANHIVVDDAVKGRVAAPPSALPNGGE